MRSQGPVLQRVAGAGRSRDATLVAAAGAVLLFATTAAAQPLAPELEVLSYTTTLHGATNDAGSLEGADNPFMVDLAAE